MVSAAATAPSFFTPEPAAQAIKPGNRGRKGWATQCAAAASFDEAADKPLVALLQVASSEKQNKWHACVGTTTTSPKPPENTPRPSRRV